MIVKVWGLALVSGSGFGPVVGSYSSVRSPSNRLAELYWGVWFGCLALLLGED